MTTTKVRVSLPEKLPNEGLTAVDFETWRSDVLIYLSQSEEYERFLSGGVYSTWEALDDEPSRLTELAETDHPPAPNAQNAAAIATRLATRNKQLKTMLGQVAGKCNKSMYRDVMDKSTCMEDIWELIEIDYDIQKKGRHFMKLDLIRFNPAGSETANAFYRRLRCFFADNLRLKGEQLKSKKGKPLLKENEKMSPTLENTVVYMALREIDPRLPLYVEKEFGHRMDKDTTLYDLQVDIFQAIPRMISEMNSKDGSLGAVSLGGWLQQETTDYFPQEVPAITHEFPQQETPTLAATGSGFNRMPFMPRNSGGFRPRFQNPRFSTPYRGTQRPPFSYQGARSPRPPRYQSPSSTGKYCRLCRDAGFPRQVFQAHNMSECNRWTRDSVAQIRSMVLELNINPDDYPEEGGVEQDS